MKRIDLEEFKRAREGLKKAMNASQQEVTDGLKTINQALELILEEFTPKDVSDEIKNLLLSMCKKLDLLDAKAILRKRAPKVSVDQKIAWLREQLKGNREGVLKSKLLELYSIQYRCKLNPNCLDLAIEMAGFETQSIEGSKHVMVVKRSRKASE